MNKYTIPATVEFVEDIAKAIARERLYQETISILVNIVGIDNTLLEDTVEKSVDSVFEIMWAGKTKEDEANKEIFRKDALTAIRTINLKLLTQLPGEG